MNFVPETLDLCEAHYIPPISKYISCEDFGNSDGMNGSCHWCKEMTPYQWHMCQDHGQINTLMSGLGRISFSNVQDAAKYIEKRKQACFAMRFGLVKKEAHAISRKRYRGIAYPFTCPACEKVVPSNKPYWENVEYCSHCGKRLDDTFQNFCPNCGAEIKGITYE